MTTLHSPTVELKLSPDNRSREEEMRALLTLSRDIAAAQDEGELASAMARALEALFPRRCFCVRFLHPNTLALTSLYAHGRLRPHARERVSLRRSAVEKTGLDERQLAARGLAVGEHDEPVFDSCDRATVVPLAVKGTLFGVVHLEYEAGAPGDPQQDEPLLIQIANQAALGVRNLRSLEEVTHLKRYLEDLIENANALICVAGLDGRILVVNGALRRLLGVDASAALGRDLRGFVVPDERRRFDEVLARAAEGEAVNSETRLLLQRGAEARIAYSTSSIYGASGEVEGLIAIGQDLTRLRQLEQHAERAQRLAELGQLAAGIVHELNNPLTAVTVYSETLHEKFSHRGADAADLEKLRTIRDAGDRLLRFSRDLMTYARPTPERVEEVDLPALVQKAAAMCEPVLTRSRAKVQCQLETVPRLYGVRASLLQVMVNLLTNAAQAMPAGGGHIEIALRRDGEAGVTLHVADDGTGMAPEVATRIFEPFFTTKPPEHGTGLGLSIAQRIVVRHGGTIGVESALGQGTRFTVKLPLRPPA